MEMNDINIVIKLYNIYAARQSYMSIFAAWNIYVLKTFSRQKLQN